MAYVGTNASPDELIATEVRRRRELRASLIRFGAGFQLCRLRPWREHNLDNQRGYEVR